MFIPVAGGALAVDVLMGSREGLTPAMVPAAFAPTLAAVDREWPSVDEYVATHVNSLLSAEEPLLRNYAERDSAPAYSPAAVSSFADSAEFAAPPRRVMGVDHGGIVMTAEGAEVLRETSRVVERSRAGGAHGLRTAGLKAPVAWSTALSRTGWGASISAMARACFVSCCLRVSMMSPFMSQ